MRAYFRGKKDRRLQELHASSVASAPNAGTYVDFVGYDEQGGKEKQVAVLQTNGPHDQELLVRSLFDAINRTWPNGDISFEVTAQKVIVRVL